MRTYWSRPIPPDQALQGGEAVQCLRRVRRDDNTHVYSALLDSLLDKHGAVGPASNGNLSCRISVDADSVIQAAALGIEYAQAAALRCGISPATVIGTEVVIQDAHGSAVAS